MSLVTEEIRAKASEIHHGKEVCKANFQRLLREVGLPNGLIPLNEVEECGYVEETGFVWMKLKKETKHKFESIGKLVSYATEVTAYAEPCKIKKLTGVKAKEIMIWVNINEISVDSPDSEKIVFKAIGGISRTFPTAAFVVEEKAAVIEEKVSTAASVVEQNAAVEGKVTTTANMVEQKAAVGVGEKEAKESMTTLPTTAFEVEEKVAVGEEKEVKESSKTLPTAAFVMDEKTALVAVEEMRVKEKKEIDGVGVSAKEVMVNEA